MKLRKRFCGVVGSLAVMSAGVFGGEPQTARQPGVAPAASVSQNQQSANEIAKAIAREVPEHGYTVDIEVQRGLVVLRGSASGPAQMHRILRAAQARAGARGVVNEMKAPSSEIRQVAMQEVELAPSAVPAPEMAVPQSAQGMSAPSAEYMFPQGAAPQYDAPFLPPFAWPAKAPYPNYTAVQYPKHYTSTQWPQIGPFHPYPEPPLDWRKVKAFSLAGLKPVQMSQDPPIEWQCFNLCWDDGHWYLRFKDPWWARRGFLNSLCDPAEEAPSGCGTPMGCGYHLSFDRACCTHKYIR